MKREMNAMNNIYSLLFPQPPCVRFRISFYDPCTLLETIGSFSNDDTTATRTEKKQKAY